MYPCRPAELTADALSTHVSDPCRLLGPWLVATATYLVYLFGFSEREAGQESAYTVFNDNMRALPGQLRAEDVQRDLMRGVAGM